MDWDNIRLFLAVARGGRFSAAALTLGIDEATVGRRLQALEKSLGNRLFDRKPTGSVLTPKGERFLRAAEDVEERVLRAEQALSLDAASVSGTVRIAAPDAFMTYFLCARIARLQVAHPDLNIQLVPMRLGLSLANREADIAIVVDRPSKGRLKIRRLTDYSLHHYASATYLAGRAVPKTREDLRDHALVTYVRDLLSAEHLNYVPELLGPGYRRVECASAVGQVMAVRSGAGIGILHDFVAHDDPQLKILLPDTVFRRSYWMVAHDSMAEAAPVKVALAFIEAEVKQHSAIFRPRA